MLSDERFTFSILVRAMATNKEQRKSGPIDRLKKSPAGEQAGVPIFEVSRWRCAACGISLFYMDGTCSVCGGTERIPQRPEDVTPAVADDRICGPDGKLRRRPH